MATEIDYWGLRVGLQSAINSYPGLENIPVILEEDDDPPMEQLPAVLVQMTGRSTPADIQRIAAGTRTDHRIVFSIWVLHYSPASRAEAVRLRDGVLSKVEVALMSDRVLGGRLYNSLRLRAGRVFGARGEGGLFTTGTETLVEVDVHTSTL